MEVQDPSPPLKSDASTIIAVPKDISLKENTTSPVIIDSKNVSNNVHVKESTTASTGNSTVSPSKQQSNSEKVIVAEIPAVDADDNLINELEKMEGLKKDDATTNATSGITEGVQKTSDLLKDLEDDPTVTDGNAQKSSAKNGNGNVDDISTATKSTAVIESSKAAASEPLLKTTDEVDRAQVDSTTEVSLKRKHSEENLTASGNAIKKQNIIADSNKKSSINEVQSTSADIKKFIPSPSKVTKPEPPTTTTTAKEPIVTAGGVATSKTDTDTAISSTSNDLLKKSTTANVSDKKIENLSNVVTFGEPSKPEKKPIVGNVSSPVKSAATKLDIEETVTSTHDDQKKVNSNAKNADKKSPSEADSSEAKKPNEVESKVDVKSPTTTKIETKTVLDSTVSLDGTKAENKNDLIEKMDVDDGDDKSAVDKTSNDENKEVAVNNGESGTPKKEKSAKTGDEKTVSEDVVMSESVDPSDDIKTTTGSESDNLTHAKISKKYNGLTDGITEDEDESSSATSSITKNAKIINETKANLVSITNGSKLDATIQQNLKENLYEVSVWYEENEMKFLSVERLDEKKLDEISTSVTEQKSDAVTTISSDDATPIENKTESPSNGSVDSSAGIDVAGEKLETVSAEKNPETLQSSGAASSSTSSSSMINEEQKSVDVKFAIPALPQQPRTKHSVKGVVALCNFMIDHFGKIKKSFVSDDDDEDEYGDDETSSTPTTGRGRKKKTTANEVTPKSTTKRGAPTKRSLDKSPSDDDGEPKSKQSKSTSKKSAQQQTPTKDDEEQHKIEYSVLARWVDKKYYAGRVTEAKPGNRFVVLFEDGASKILQHDYIVFGEEDGMLPLINQSVHALIDEETYEPGVVTETKRDGDRVLYTVETESKTVTVTSSDIYLEDDQAKVIQSVTKDVVLDFLKTPETPSSKRAGRPSAKLEESQATTSTSRGRPKKTASGGASQSSTPEPGFSGNVAAGGSGRKGRKPNKSFEPPPRLSESSDISDTFESAPSSPIDNALEAVGGVQPELQRTPKESELNKHYLIAEYLGNDASISLEDFLGPIPNSRSLFRNKHFLLTCTIPMKSPRINNDGSKQTNGIDTTKYFKMSCLPFVKDHLRNQIEGGGGKVYEHFEDIPKNKYKLCKLIAPHPCMTAKYVQCLAANIPAISHEWIVECCESKTIIDTKQFLLPAGWSIIEEQYKRWSVGRAPDQRCNLTPLTSVNVIIASQQPEFIEFWTRVCKLAGAVIRVAKSSEDLTPSTKGYLLIDNEEYLDDTRSKAEHFQIPIVSTIWVVQTLILGKVCCPESHVKLKQMYFDDD